MKPDWDIIARRVITWVVTILVPLALILSSIRLLLTPTFLQIEYNTPGFPPDPFGFTLEDRIKWSNIASEYLINDQEINFLSNLQFEDSSPLYNQRELDHMVDVKRLTRVALRMWEVSLGLIIGLGLAAWGAKWSREYRLGLSRGGWMTVGIVITVLIGVALSFSALFTGFHQIFFEGDTWLFYYSDTLIRLFPMRFWRDAFIMIGFISLVGGAILGHFTRPV